MNSAKGEVTVLLDRWSNGDRRAFEQLTPLVYEQVKALAGYYLRMERPDHTLQSTALVHEAWLRLLEQGCTLWESKQHFFAVTSRIMRHILVDHARRRSASKRDHDQAPFDEALTVAAGPEMDMVALNEALESLGHVDAEKLRVVELRFFGGLSVEQTADVLGTSTATVKRQWAVARAWLYRALTARRFDVPITAD
jgi:RNA polymerase sigma factor (TIGR02999 family)